jgi:hypothetical protein
MQRGPGRGTAGCDNAQTAVDSRHPLIIAHEVPHDTGDRDWRRPLALPAKAVRGHPCAAVADGGA